jgi:hypothetical protein
LKPRSVQARTLGAAGVEDDVQIQARARAVAGQGDPGAFTPETDQARIVARAR